jgi:hypothetical protein
MLLETFFLVTYWQGDCGWEISVFVEGFFSAIDAVKFGILVSDLILENNRLFLIIDKSGSPEETLHYCSLGNVKGDRIQLSDYDIRVFRIKSELTTNQKNPCEDDYIEQGIPIKLFSEIKGLNKKFNLLSYQVLDENYTPIEFDSIYLERSKNDSSFPFFPPDNELVFIRGKYDLFWQHVIEENTFIDYQYWICSDGKTIAVQKENSECIKKIINFLDGTFVDNPEIF